MQWTQWNSGILWQQHCLQCKNVKPVDAVDAVDKQYSLLTTSPAFAPSPVCISLFLASTGSAGVTFLHQKQCKLKEKLQKKRADQKEKENIKKEAVAKARKIKTVQKRKHWKNVVKKISLVKMKIFVQRSLRRNQSCFGTA